MSILAFTPYKLRLAFYYYFRILLCCLILSACSGTDASEDSLQQQDVIQAEPLFYRSQGNVAIGIAAAFSEICVLTQAEYCTRANHLGNFQLPNLQQNSGWVSANFVAANGDNLTMYSLFWLENLDDVAIFNINPTTDVMVRSWLAHHLQTTPELCFMNPDCLMQSQTMLTLADIQKVETSLEKLLQPFWPNEQSSALTELYIADPQVNPIDLMHEAIAYSIDESEPAQLSVLNQLNESIASAPLALLALGDTAQLQAQADEVTQDEFERALTLPAIEQPQNSDISISIDIQPGRYGQAPFFINVITDAAAPHLDNSMQIDNYLIWPNGQVTQWQTPEYNLELTQGGRYDVVVHAIDSEGHEMIRSQSITLSRDINSEATYGSNGSCIQQNLSKNNSNICLEMLDGGKIKSCNEDNNLDYVSIGCPQSKLNVGDYLGRCEIISSEVLIFHYQNPLRLSNENVEQQQTRLAQLCLFQSGVWEQ